MNLSIFLNNSRWTKINRLKRTIFFIGYFDFKGKIVLSASDLEKLLSDKITINNFENYLKEELLPFCNGNFAFIISTEEVIIAVTDYIRNYQILFQKADKEFLLMDHISETIKKSLLVDNEKCEEFLLSGFVIGNDTVYTNLYSMQPAEILFIKKGEYKKVSYFTLDSNPFSKDLLSINEEVIFNRMDKLFLSVFKRMVKSCPSVRNWIIPLSGGYDSRLIINYLYRLGYKNVICFTYGVGFSDEVKISKATAEALGYKWFFVDYTIKKDWVDLHKNGLFDKYIQYSFNGCNLSHVQDLLAIKVLKDKGIINENDVVVPGHTAFTETESEEILNLHSENDSVNYVFSKYYNLIKSKNSTKLKKRLQNLFEDENQTAINFPLFFNWSERQVKFIGNSVRAYEFFGLDWRMPFWEREIFDFWKMLDYKDRVERKIFIKASKEKLFVKELKDIPIIDKFNKSSEVNILFIKRIIPLRIKSFIAAQMKWSSKVPVGTNEVFTEKGKNVMEIMQPIHVLPKNIKRYLKPYLLRKPYQMNVNSLSVFYILKTQVIMKKSL